MRRSLTWILYAPLPLCGAALSVCWLAERALVGRTAAIAWVFGLATFAAAVALALARLAVGPGSRRSAYVLLLRGYVVQGWAIACYVALRGGHLDALGPLRALVVVVLPAWLAWGLLPTVALEHAVATTRHAPSLDAGRVRLAVRAARLLWLALVSFAAANYAGAAFSRQIDLSRAQRTQPSEATVATVTGVMSPLRLTAFFPPGNAVAEALRPYLDALAAASPAIQVEVRDQAFAAEAARSLGVRGNGALAIEAQGRTEVLPLALDLEHARRGLRQLDAEVLRRLRAVLRAPRHAYVVSGHGEWPLTPTAGRPGRDLVGFRELLEDEGYVVHALGPETDLGRAVPDDAALLAVVGPTQAFGPQELESVRRYWNQGGRLFLCIDAATLPPRSLGERGPLPLATLVGTELLPAPVANAAFGVRLGELGFGASYDLLTTHAADHPAAASLRRRPGRVGLVLPGAAGVRALAGASPTLDVRGLLPPMPGSWLDTNRNGRHDAGEAQAGFWLAAAVDKAAADGNAGVQASRAVVVGDADFAGSTVLQNPGNAAFVADVVRWLGGDAEAAGTGVAAPLHNDVPLMHRRADDAVGFYGVTYGVPTLLMGLALVRGRRGRARRAGADASHARKLP